MVLGVNEAGNGMRLVNEIENYSHRDHNMKANSGKFRQNKNAQFPSFEKSFFFGFIAFRFQYSHLRLLLH